MDFACLINFTIRVGLRAAAALGIVTETRAAFLTRSFSANIERLRNSSALQS